MEDVKNIKQAEAPGLETPGLTKRDDLIIHSIPKRFINSKQVPQEHHKGIGVLVLGLGVIALLAGAVLVYFFVFKSPVSEPKKAVNSSKQDASKNIETQKTAQNMPAETDSSESSTKKEVPEKKEITVPKIASSTPEENIDSSSVNNTSDQEVDSASTSEVKRVEIDPIVEEVVIPPPADNDQDGLYDLEESVLGTNVNLPDSDGDAYDDLSELKKLYNPAGSGKLIVNDTIEKYTNTKYNYSFLYPKAWQVETTNTQETVILKIDNNQFFQIIVAADTQGKFIQEWYKEQFETVNIKPSQHVYKSGWNGIKSEDGLVYYLNHPQDTIVYALTYSASEGVSKTYQNIVDMIIVSLELN